MGLVRVRSAFKFWLETDEGYVLGKGPFKLLVKVDETGTLRDAAEELGMSYRYAWGLIKEIEKNLRMAILKTYKGGMHGGGGAVLTDEAKELLRKYEIAEKAFLEVSQRLNDKLLQ